MNLIRIFLWTLASVMILQGFLSADEYGTAPSMIGGVSLTMSVWKENAQTWFSSEPKFIPLPRIIVQSALRETALHPGIQVVPKLQQTLKLHQRTWDLFREEEIRWMLEHAILIGGVTSDPDARSLWAGLDRELNRTEVAMAAARGRLCRVRALDPVVCDEAAATVADYEATVAVQRNAIELWRQVVDMERWFSTRDWWLATGPAAGESGQIGFLEIAHAVARLHDIESPRDPRLFQTFELVANASQVPKNPWRRRILLSLLQGEVWAGCLEHIRLREGRVRELMMVAGIQDMLNAHERVLNATLRVVGSADEKRLVHNWFGEMSGYAWFLPDDLPSLVRRCVGQDSGDCTRIGPTEIVDLTAKAAEGSKIVADWTRRLFIGMWNALPIVVVLFVLELVVLCLELRFGFASGFSRSHQGSPALQDERRLSDKTIVLRLEGRSRRRNQDQLTNIPLLE